MKNKRKIIAYIATSADGFIARKDGGIDWLDRPYPPGAYGMPAFFKSVDTVLWGRTTYDEAVERGSAFSFGEHLTNYVFTHHPPKRAPDPSVQFVNEPIGPFAGKLREKPGKDIWMMGGGEIIASFLDAGQIDEFSIHVIPVFIGEGIPLIAPRRRTVELKLISTRKFVDGVVHLNYRVLPAAAAKSGRRPKLQS